MAHGLYPQQFEAYQRKQAIFVVVWPQADIRYILRVNTVVFFGTIAFYIQYLSDIHTFRVSENKM